MGEHGKMSKRNQICTVIITALMLFASIGVVVDVHAASVSLNKKSVTLTVGESTILKVKGTKKNVTWKSSDKKVVTVTKKGKITAKKKGKATIYASVAGKKLKCKVTVKPTPMTEYWSSDSVAANQLREYVTKVTNEKDPENFIPIRDRIAVFDMDGTLTCETYFTYYDTMMFIEYCLVDHPDKVSEELKEAAREIKPGYKADETLARNFAKAYAGMTIQELYDYAVEFGKKNTNYFHNMQYRDGAYLPMVELVKYLYENDFTIYVVSGTERTTTRAIIANSPFNDYVTPNHIIGTEFEVKEKGHEDEPSNMNYKYENGNELVYTGGFIQKNLNANKAIYIEREIGKRPVLAFGNSGSDTSMLNYALDDRNPYPAEAYMIVADDDVRERGTEDWTTKSAEYRKQGYTPISMKNEFLQIYPEGIMPKKELQDQEVDLTSDSGRIQLVSTGCTATGKRAA